MQLTNQLETSINHAPVAAGATDVTDCDVVDMQGYDGVRFIVGFGSITTNAVTGLRAQQAAAAYSATALTNGADLEGSAVVVPDDGDNKAYILDIYKPRERYVQLIIDRATQNAVVDFVLAEKYGPRKLPVTKNADINVQEFLVSPAEGTA